MTFTFKEIVHPEIEMLFIHIDCFAASCWVFKDIGCKGVCLLSNKIELDATSLVVLKVPPQKSTFDKTSFKKKQYLFPEIMTIFSFF